jgi:translation initiation factor IF-3
MNKISKKNQKFMSSIGIKLSELVDAHPEQTVQEQWMLFLEEGFTYERYIQFMEWRSYWFELNNHH